MRVQFSEAECLKQISSCTSINKFSPVTKHSHSQTSCGKQ
jgi:hypothetical protein